MKRADFLKNIAAGTATLFVVPTVLTSCEEDLPEPDPGNPNSGNGDLVIDLTDSNYSSLATTGGSVIEGGIIIFNTGDEIIALSAACTHSGCTVSYSHSASELPCPCHGSRFSTSGSVLQGPANSPLRSYKVEQEGDILTIS